MTRTLRAVAALTAVALLLTACGGDEEPEAAPSPAPSPTASPEPGPTAPLTGREIVDDSILDRPALAIKVENSPASRPQAGLSEADIVFEELVEGGITRFIAIFHSTLPSDVGPIRSGRFVDAEVLPPFHAILGLSGAADVVVKAIAKAGLETVYDDGTGEPFYRKEGRRAPHNLFADPADILAQKEDVPAARPAFTYDAEPPAGDVGCAAAISTGAPTETATERTTPAPAPSASAPSDCDDPGESITITMSGASVTGWEWDDRTRSYIRSQNGEPFEDAAGDLVAAENVVALAMEVGSGGGADPAGNPLTDTIVIGEGRGVVLRDGHWFEVRWSKPDALSHFRIIGSDGEDFPLAPGRTWLHLAPRNGVPEAGPAAP